MNKSTIGTWLLVISLSFVIGFFTSQHTFKKGDGVVSPKEEIYLSRIDSLKSVIQNSESRIDTIYITKTKLKIKYETDTLYIQSAPFDSIRVLFSRKYPRHNSNK